MADGVTALAKSYALTPTKHAAAFFNQWQCVISERGCGRTFNQRNCVLAERNYGLRCFFHGIDKSRSRKNLKLWIHRARIVKTFFNEFLFLLKERCTLFKGITLLNVCKTDLHPLITFIHVSSLKKLSTGFVQEY